jgi:hypothetical protein
MRSPKGPAPNSEFEHSSIPATIKKMFNLSSNFLTHRDAWAGTFEDVVGELSSPRTDCPGMNSSIITHFNLSTVIFFYYAISLALIGLIM